MAGAALPQRCRCSWPPSAPARWSSRCPRRSGTSGSTRWSSRAGASRRASWVSMPLRGHPRRAIAGEVAARRAVGREGRAGRVAAVAVDPRAVSDALACGRRRADGTGPAGGAGLTAIVPSARGQRRPRRDARRGRVAGARRHGIGYVAVTAPGAIRSPCRDRDRSDGRRADGRRGDLVAQRGRLEDLHVVAPGEDPQPDLDGPGDRRPPDQRAVGRRLAAAALGCQVSRGRGRRPPARSAGRPRSPAGRR